MFRRRFIFIVDFYIKNKNTQTQYICVEIYKQSNNNAQTGEIHRQVGKVKLEKWKTKGGEDEIT